MAIRESRIPTLLAREQSPEFADADALDWQHAVLQAIEILPVHRRHKLAGDEA